MTLMMTPDAENLILVQEIVVMSLMLRKMSGM